MDDKLPICIEERSRDLIGLPPVNAKVKPHQELESFVGNLIKHNAPVSNEELSEQFNRTQLLGLKAPRVRPHKTLRKKIYKIEKDREPNRGKKRMTSVEKRKLGLMRINRNNKTFKMFIPIHKMWKSYAQEALGLSHFLGKDEQDLGNKNLESLQTKLKKLEFFGSIVKVTQSRCSEYIGLEGIVIQETKNTFTVISIDNSIKIIPKLHSEFSFILGKLGFSILGNHLHQRPVDRAKQNFKKHCLWL